MRAMHAMHPLGQPAQTCRPLVQPSTHLRSTASSKGASPSGALNSGSSAAVSWLSGTRWPATAAASRASLKGMRSEGAAPEAADPSGSGCRGGARPCWRSSAASASIAAISCAFSSADTMRAGAALAGVLPGLLPAAPLPAEPTAAGEAPSAAGLAPAAAGAAAAGWAAGAGVAAGASAVTSSVAIGCASAAACSAMDCCCCCCCITASEAAASPSTSITSPSCCTGSSAAAAVGPSAAAATAAAASPPAAAAAALAAPEALRPRFGASPVSSRFSLRCFSNHLFTCNRQVAARRFTNAMRQHAAHRSISHWTHGSLPHAAQNKPCSGDPTPQEAHKTTKARKPLPALPPRQAPLQAPPWRQCWGTHSQQMPPAAERGERRCVKKEASDALCKVQS